MTQLSLRRVYEPDAMEELAFAERAVTYLERQGVDHKGIVMCLMKELELDRETAEALAKLAA
jgi:hypothetical protein